LFSNQAAIGKLAFEAGVALADRRRFHDFCLFRRQSKMFEFVDIDTAGIADADDTSTMGPGSR